MSKERMDELVNQKYLLQRQISLIDQEMQEIRVRCSHPQEHQDVVSLRVLEPRSSYDVYNDYKSIGDRLIETRNVKCLICNHIENQFRFQEEEWMNAIKWQNTMLSN